MRDRSAIVAELPRMFNAMWAECDRGRYFDLHLPPPRKRLLEKRDQMIRSASWAIRLAHRDVIEVAALALGAESAATEIEDLPLANYYRFVLRNRFAGDAARHYFRLLDQIIYHLYEVSDRTLLPGTKPKHVSLSRLQRSIVERKVGGPERLSRTARKVVRLASRDLTSTGCELFERFRHVDTHRYPVGIDHISYGFSRRDGDVRLRPGGEVFVLGDVQGESYAMYTTPDIDFGTVAEFLRRVMRNSTAILAELADRRFLLSA